MKVLRHFQLASTARYRLSCLYLYHQAEAPVSTCHLLPIGCTSNAILPTTSIMGSLWPNCRSSYSTPAVPPSCASGQYMHCQSRPHSLAKSACRGYRSRVSHRICYTDNRFPAIITMRSITATLAVGQSTSATCPSILIIQTGMISGERVPQFSKWGTLLLTEYVAEAGRHIFFFFF